MDKYRFVKQLGEGGQGTAFRCIHVPSGESCVAKIVKCKDVISLNAALREVKVLSSLSHPHIIKYRDFFVQATAPSTLSQSSEFGMELVVIMELCERGDLGQVIWTAERQYCSSHQLLCWLVQILHALGHIHALNIVHRDVKPNNVLLTHTSAKLGDFGLARDDHSTMTTRVGTPLYAPPEYLQDGLIHAPGDVWAIGCIALEAISCVPLFERPGLLAARVMQKPILQRDFLAPQPQGKGAIQPGHLSKSVLIVLTNMMRVDPRQRPSAVDAANALWASLNEYTGMQYPNGVHHAHKKAPLPLHKRHSSPQDNHKQTEDAARLMDNILDQEFDVNVTQDPIIAPKDTINDAGEQQGSRIKQQIREAANFESKNLVDHDLGGVMCQNLSASNAQSTGTLSQDKHAESQERIDSSGQTGVSLNFKHQQHEMGQGSRHQQQSFLNKFQLPPPPKRTPATGVLNRNLNAAQSAAKRAVHSSSKYAMIQLSSSCQYWGEHNAATLLPEGDGVAIDNEITSRYRMKEQFSKVVQTQRNVYCGRWHNGERDGLGLTIHSDGKSYCGEWKADRYQGWGTLSEEGGLCIDGFFDKGAANGPAAVFDPRALGLAWVFYKNGSVVQKLTQVECKARAASLDVRQSLHQSSYKSDEWSKDKSFSHDHGCKGLSTVAIPTLQSLRACDSSESILTTQETPAQSAEVNPARRSGSFIECTQVSKDQKHQLLDSADVQSANHGVDLQIDSDDSDVLC